MTRAAGDFFLESLASFEMVQRGFREATEAARLERRQTEMSRQLSTFLADASLALDASESLEEMLRLVAEQARELVGAQCCVATVATEGQPRTAEAVSFDQTDRRWAGFVRWLDLFAIYRFIRTSGGSVRLAGEQLLEQPQFGSAAGQPPAPGMACRIADGPRRQRARRHPAVRQAGRSLHRRRRGRHRPPGPDGLGRHREDPAVPRKRIANGPSVGHTREAPAHDFECAARARSRRAFES